MSKRLLVLILCIVMLFSITACKRSEQTTQPDAPLTEVHIDETALNTAIINIMDDRLLSLQTEDYDLYMSTIGRNNQFYFNEQERWFMNMIDPRISNISFEVTSVEMIDDTTGVANIHQEHDMDNHYSIDYPLLFKYEDGKWMDYGYNFEVYETDRFYVMYTEGEPSLDEFIKMLDDAFDHLDEMYELKPVDEYEMKLFSDQEMLRQRCIPASSWLFTGWSEPDESLKMYTGHDAPYIAYAGIVQHELVHHVTIRMCNNNLPVWILEGIAMYDGNSYYGIESSRKLSAITKDKVSQTIMDIELHDLSTNLTSQEISNYYTTSYMYVRYIEETYGRDKLMEIFTTAGQKPFHDSTLNYEFESNNQKTADEVLLSVLDLTKEELSDEYFDWLDEFDFSEFG